jgi:hypothetical protein
MNHNSLIIAVDGSTARLFRLAETNDPARPVELIEVGAVTASTAGDVAEADARGARSSRSTPAHPPPSKLARAEELGPLARRAAERAASFGQHHLCNPVIVVASQASWPAIARELELELPNVYIRPVYCDAAGLTPPQLLERLQTHEAFAEVPHARHGS